MKRLIKCPKIVAPKAKKCYVAVFRWYTYDVKLAGGATKTKRIEVDAYNQAEAYVLASDKLYKQYGVYGQLIELEEKK